MVFSLVSKCKVFNFVSDERFRKPVTRTELEEFGRGWASDNSRRKWCWVLKALPSRAGVQ